ncbi:MAG TPA: decarboxylating 6-phosphogluconate dehydrogenase [Casimicrobiaceae bacterium]|nr:decarboxylating 6-phosphogluconate dehydrogenase [Casimicrobiaceae bacterium]
MQLGIIGLGRMGANIARRLMRAGHACVVHDIDRSAVDALAREGAAGAPTLEALAARLAPPRALWMMLPAAAVDETIGRLEPLLSPGDVLIDGGNSDYVDDLRRARALSERGVRYVDVGTSGGVWGLDEGYCLMIGGEEDAVRRLDPIFAALAPGSAAAPETPSRNHAPGTAPRGYLHCGPVGAGHLVKMVHNGIEYGLMAAYAEGLNLLRHANAGARSGAADAETAPLADPARYRYDIDVAEVAEVWRRGSVVRSWLLDLIADALASDPDLSAFHGLVSDSGEGRWTVKAAIDLAVPAPVLSTALFARFASRGQDEFANRLLSAMRREFGGHREPAGAAAEHAE